MAEEDDLEAIWPGSDNPDVPRPVPPSHLPAALVTRKKWEQSHAQARHTGFLFASRPQGWTAAARLTPTPARAQRGAPETGMLKELRGSVAHPTSLMWGSWHSSEPPELHFWDAAPCCAATSLVPPSQLLFKGLEAAGG